MQYIYTRHGAVACAQNSARNKRAISGPYIPDNNIPKGAKADYDIQRNFNVNWFFDIYSKDATEKFILKKFWRVAIIPL